MTTKWTLTIQGIDLGDRIPTTLKPHDHPLEAWAAEAIGDLLGELETQFHLQRINAIVALGQSEVEGGREVQEAIQAYAEQDLQVVKYMHSHFKITKE